MANFVLAHLIPVYSTLLYLTSILCKSNCNEFFIDFIEFSYCKCKYAIVSCLLICQLYSSRRGVHEDFDSAPRGALQEGLHRQETVHPQHYERRRR